MSFSRLLVFSVLVLGIALGSPIVLANELTPSEEQARSVVAAYVAALERGDTEALKTILGGELLEERRASLNNPAYPELLIRTYSGATSSLLGSRSLAAGQISVDTEITLSGGEVIRATFIVEAVRDSNRGPSELRIVSESQN